MNDLAQELPTEWPQNIRRDHTRGHYESSDASGKEPDGDER